MMTEKLLKLNLNLQTTNLDILQAKYLVFPIFVVF